jgi:hypothetical protein
MGYIEREVGHSMRWWDSSRDVRRALVDIINHETFGNERLISSYAKLANENNTTKHHPSYFSDEVSLDELVARKNLLTVYSGCSIATWTYDGIWNPREPFKDCQRQYKDVNAYAKRSITNETMLQIYPYDSIYVPIASLREFVKDILPKLESDIILITGQKSNVPPIRREVYDKVIDHPKILHWFLQNLSEYAYDARHPKVGRGYCGLHVGMHL